MAKRWKRCLAAGLVCCMGLSLAACGKGKSGTENAGGGDSETVNLKVGYARDTSFKYEGSETMESNAWVDLYKENGITLDVMYNVETSQGEEKLAQLIMSGDYPDFMAINAKNYLDWSEQGVFLDLAPYFEEYASDSVKEFYSNTEWGPEILKAATTDDGEIYGLPTAGAGNDSLNLLWIRKDWLDKLGLAEPKTVDELIKVAQAFTEEDPDGNGQDDTYGLAFNGKDVFSNIGGFDGFFQMFGVAPGIPAGTIPIVDNNGQAVYGGNDTESMKESLGLLKELYDKGYMAQDFVTAGSEQVIAQLSSGKTGMMFGTMANIGTAWQNVLELQPDAHFIALGLPGETEETWGQAFYTNTPPVFYCLSSQIPEDKKEEYVKAFFKVLDLGTYYLGQPDERTQEEYEIYNGKSGVYTGWQLALGGCGVPNSNFIALPRHQEALKSGDTSAMNVMNLRDFTSMKKYVDNKDKRAELSEEDLNSFNAGLFYYSVWGDPQCAYVALQAMVDKDHLLKSAYEAPQTKTMTQNSVKLDTLAKETIVNIVMGNQEISDYDEFLNTWNSLGGEQITQEANEWYQANKE